MSTENVDQKSKRTLSAAFIRHLRQASSIIQGVSNADVECRQVIINETEKSRFCSNGISTTKYNVLTFLPKFFFEQFTKVSNVFFLVMALIQQIPGISPVGRYTTIIPLTFVFAVSACKEIIEDVKRRRFDRKTNKTKCLVLRDTWMVVEWQKLNVGDLVMVKIGEMVPADLVLISTSEDQGVCYIETANLDGEANYKIRQAVQSTWGMINSQDLKGLRAEISCDLPNNKLYSFNGKIKVGHSREIPLTCDNTVFRGCVLKNTEWIIGCIVNTGSETKLMMNSSAAPIKKSKMEVMTNYYMLVLISILLSLTLITTVSHYFVYNVYAKDHWYMFHANTSNYTFYWSFLTYLIAFHLIIPISLSVTIEFVKFFQTYFINYDKKMYDRQKNTYASVKTSSIIEDLGQINYIFSDKTGTLTKNLMKLHSLSINGNIYNMDYNGIEELKNEADIPEVRLFFEHIVLCNTVVPVKADLFMATNPSTSETDLTSEPKLNLQSTSPDETSLVEGAYNCGYEFISRTQDSVVFSRFGVEEKWSTLNTLEFTSDRKRMSVIVKNPEGKIFLFCKGADSVIFNRLDNNSQSCEGFTYTHLEDFATSGLRTLCIAYRIIDELEYEDWSKRYYVASTLMEDRAEQLSLVYDIIEKDLKLMGATAILDELQNDVPESIHSLISANIRMWMLTGDRTETAINIGYSTNLLKETTDVKIINCNSTLECKNLLQDIIREHDIVVKRIPNGKRVNPPKTKDLALVIPGSTLSYLFESSCVEYFIDVSVSCRSVICCRVSPLQKQQVVLMIKRNVHDIVTLAVGDGGNDCSMIQAANVGVGISGNEGMQAANCSDFVINQFSHLRRLILYHGASSYRRLCTTIYYCYYKNIVFSQMSLFYSFYDKFSAALLFSPAAAMFYNTCFTSLPPFAFGLLDQPVSSKAFVNIPRLYATSQKGYIFTIKKLIFWILDGYLHAASLFFLFYNSFSMGVFNSSGFPISRSVYGIILYTGVLIVVTLRAAMELTSWTWMTLLGVASGLVMWIGFLSVYCRPAVSAFFEPIMSGADIAVYSSILFWLTIPIPFITVIPDFVYIAIRNALFKPAHIAIAELERSRAVDWEERRHLSKASEKLHFYESKKDQIVQKYLGFAFSIQEEFSSPRVYLS